MKSKVPCLRLILAHCAAFIFTVMLPGATVLAQTGYTGIFGGGPFYINATNNIAEIENSGFTEAIIWNIEVKTNGDLNFNGEFPLVSNGVYIGGQTHPDFAGNMALLKQGTIQRVTFSIGSSNVGDWQDVKALVNSQGTGMDSILYKNFAALKAAIPALDALDFDDENSFDSASTIAFGVMLGQLGYKVNPDAFNNNSTGRTWSRRSTVSSRAQLTAFTCRPTPAAAATTHVLAGISALCQSGPAFGTSSTPPHKYKAS